MRLRFSAGCRIFRPVVLFPIYIGMSAGVLCRFASNYGRIPGGGFRCVFRRAVFPACVWDWVRRVSWAWSALLRCFYGAMIPAFGGSVCIGTDSGSVSAWWIFAVGLIVSAWWIFSAWFRSGLLYAFRLGWSCWMLSRCAACRTVSAWRIVPAVVRRLSGGVAIWPKVAADGATGNEEKKKKIHQNMVSFPKRKISSKNKADLELSIFQTGDFLISNSQNEKNRCNRARVRVRSSNFGSRLQLSDSNRFRLTAYHHLDSVSVTR